MAQIIDFYEKKRVVDTQVLCDKIKETGDEIAYLENEISQLELKLKFKKEDLKEYEDSYNSLGVC